MLTFTSESYRRNIYLHTRLCDKITVRWLGQVVRQSGLVVWWSVLVVWWSVLVVWSGGLVWWSGLDIQPRTRDRDMGFLLPIVASGQSVQIFAMSLTFMDMAGEFQIWAFVIDILPPAAWLAKRCHELGLNANILKVSGNSSAGHKVWVMQQLKNRWTLLELSCSLR